MCAIFIHTINLKPAVSQTCRASPAPQVASFWLAIRPSRISRLHWQQIRTSLVAEREREQGGGEREREQRGRDRDEQRQQHCSKLPGSSFKCVMFKVWCGGGAKGVQVSSCGGVVSVGEWGCRSEARTPATICYHSGSVDVHICVLCVWQAVRATSQADWACFGMSLNTTLSHCWGGN